jgi:hypothetical protein
MKTLLLLAITLAATVAAAQNQPPTTLNSAASAKPKNQLEAAPVKTCAYIHSFIFERHDDEAPKLVKETYCTPTGQFQIKRAAKFGVYPAMVTTPSDDAAKDTRKSGTPPK